MKTAGKKTEVGLGLLIIINRLSVLTSPKKSAILAIKSKPSKIDFWPWIKEFGKLRKRRWISLGVWFRINLR